MSFKASGPKTRPDRVKPPVPTDATPQPPSWSRRSSASSIASFHSAHFPADEESRMLSSSNDLKSQANTQFGKADYSSAIGTYDRALSELPSYLDYEMAVLQSNIAACHLKLEQWKEAVDSCEKGLNGLEREFPTKPKDKPKSKKTRKGGDTTKKSNGTQALNSDTESESDSEPNLKPPAANEGGEDDKVVELPSDADENNTQAALAALNLSDTRKSDIHRIRTKLLLRRARARSSLQPQNWSSLSSALEDYKTLSTAAYFTTLPASDQKTVRQALVSLPPRVDVAKDKEVGEMMSKLKDLGNGILKPFGLSTENFKVQQGEGGGYSLSFDQGGSKTS
ncbi:hypothetical protein LTR10_017636 [Elasticomyces elasticus]|uniref:Tetratricopeptide repeat protein 1 n=1 Tax=Exophiala sideris TaxID=1016849 RepID=A0ABR0JP60_9EURO|nr:hypothetical protein LTR10_017636 [Elasticomyces elasticus]KAK5038281.1 hypothetical protein LTS07_001751 [Exophiala sideris]KAK5044265.1 hypothetical protein LTR13_000621 [Exophiala sideris]KAK5067765.1 hypothetical protein LTR69_001754 [Exophiala sideris]KAK5183995.1 hypothetical protein LTR44_003500 [Eurotiomycetes sp. CCFEE 6388]